MLIPPAVVVGQRPAISRASHSKSMYSTSVGSHGQRILERRVLSPSSIPRPAILTARRSRWAAIAARQNATCFRPSPRTAIPAQAESVLPDQFCVLSAVCGPALVNGGNNSRAFPGASAS